MRLDHIAYRVKDRKQTAKFFQEAFGYKIQDEFPIEFDDVTIHCIAMVPPEKTGPCPWVCSEVLYSDMPKGSNDKMTERLQEYHLPPEIFISDGPPGSIVGDWVNARNGIGGVHHLAFQTESVEKTMEEWKEKGYAEFSSEKPIKCPGLTQIFTKPSLLTGVIYEFIEREEQGFCKENVAALMKSSANDLKK